MEIERAWYAVVIVKENLSWRDGKGRGEREVIELLSGGSVGTVPTTASLNKKEGTEGITIYIFCTVVTCYLLQLYNMRKKRKRRNKQQ